MSECTVRRCSLIESNHHARDNRLQRSGVAHLVNELSSVLVFGSRRSRAGALNGPYPMAVPAVTLTEYLTPAVRLASRIDGVCESTVMFVRMRETFAVFTSKPRTMIW